MGSTVVEEDYGRRILPIVVEDAARKSPDRVAYSFPITDDPSEGFHDITNSRYSNGVNRTAWWIEKSFGKPEASSFPTIGYIGPSDLRYPMLTIAAVKVGYKMMLLSPRNSVDGHLAVTDKCGCNLWILPTQRIGHVDQVLKNRPMIVYPLPELLDLLKDEAVSTYPYNKSFAEARQDPFVVLHTSGSTGLPKPIVVPNGSLATPDAHHLLPPVEGRLSQAQYFATPHRAYSTFPNFHSAGMVWCFAFPFFFELSIVLGPAMVPVNLDLVNSMFDYGNVDGSCLAPSTLEEISKVPASLERIGKTLFTCFGGGPLSQECGNRLNAVTRVFNTVGVTEGSLFPIVQAEREDWNYIHFHPFGGYTYRQTSDELFEQFQTRDPKLDLFQAFLQTFPDQDEFAIKDLYMKHPTKPGRWLYKGRADDVIVLSNGEKLNPLDMEASINDHPKVKASLVVGQGRFQTTAIIQLASGLPTSEVELNAVKESIWLNITAANVQAPAHAKLHKNNIIFASDDKPFILAGKETVLRAMTVKLYEDEINEFYAKQELSQLSEASCFDLSGIESISHGLCDLICGILELETLGGDDDIFSAGLDSLSVLKILANIHNAIRSAVKTQNDTTLDVTLVTASTLYKNPTIVKLSNALYKIVHPESQGRQDSDSENIELMQSLLLKYTDTLPARSTTTQANSKRGEISVLLTGSTGSLGSYLLDTLLSKKHIARVFCLNRSTDGEERQVKGNKIRGLQTDWTCQRVRFLHANLSKPMFGLDQDTYGLLLQQTTHIIHNQWQVDFNLTLSSFEPHIHGVRNLVDFSLATPNNASIFFISSVGIVNNQRTNASVPEVLVTDFSVTEGGYGSSKLVSELILAEAFIKSKVKCSVCRVGQISGPVEVQRGMWNKHEWLPSIIASSKYLGILPSSLPSLDRIDWLPVNQLSQIILELSELDFLPSSSTTPPPYMPVFHAVNPSPTPWSTLLPTILAYLGSSVQIVPWNTWLLALQASQKGAEIAQTPGIKLLDFYEAADRMGKLGLEMPVLETVDTKNMSKTLKEMSKVTPEWMGEWMKQWDF